MNNQNLGIEFAIGRYRIHFVLTKWSWYANHAFDHFSKLNGHGEYDDQLVAAPVGVWERGHDQRVNASVPPALHPAFIAAHSLIPRVLARVSRTCIPRVYLCELSCDLWMFCVHHGWTTSVVVSAVHGTRDRREETYRSWENPRRRGPLAGISNFLTSTWIVLKVFCFTFKEFPRGLFGAQTALVVSKVSYKYFIV